MSDKAWQAIIDFTYAALIDHGHRFSDGVKEAAMEAVRRAHGHEQSVLVAAFEDHVIHPGSCCWDGVPYAEAA